MLSEIGKNDDFSAIQLFFHNLQCSVGGFQLAVFSVQLAVRSCERSDQSTKQPSNELTNQPITYNFIGMP
jgi:hypothetical protein